MDDDALEENEKILILKSYVFPLSVAICDVMFCLGQ
jgi:hypothetical protein